MGEMTGKQRARLLKDMTETVGDLVLYDNYQQTQALSVLNANAPNLLREHARYIEELVSLGSLNRELEFLPDHREIKRRQSEGIGLKLPELSVLLAYSKMTLYDELIESNLPEDKTLVYEMNQYFPTVLSLNFPEEMLYHPLRREIIATFATNNMVNRVGPTFAFRMKELTGVGYTDVARAFAAARQIFGLSEVWKSIEELDNIVSAQTQNQLLSYVGGLLERATLWLLRHRKSPLEIQATVKYFKSDLENLAEGLPKALTSQHSEPLKKQIDILVKQDVPVKIAHRIVHFIPLSTSLDIIEITKETGRSVDFVARVYFDIGARIELIWIREKVAFLPVENHWHSLAKSRLSDDIHSHQFNIVRDIVREASTDDADRTTSEWMEANTHDCRILASLIADMKSLNVIDFATLSVAISEVHLLGRKANQSTVQ